VEKLWIVKSISTKKIQYEKIENIKPENHEILKADLEERTGLAIQEIEIGNIDFLRDSTTLTIKYFTEQ
jgi:hypothetical protein